MSLSKNNNATENYKIYSTLRNAFTDVFNHIHTNDKLQNIIVNDLEKYKHLNMAHFIIYNFKTCVNNENKYKMSSYASRLNSVIEKTKTSARLLENINKISTEFTADTLQYTSLNLIINIGIENKKFGIIENSDIFQVINDITTVVYCVPFTEQTFGIMCLELSEIKKVIDTINEFDVIIDSTEDCINLTCIENYTKFTPRKEVFDWSTKNKKTLVNLTSNNSVPIEKIIEYNNQLKSC